MRGNRTGGCPSRFSGPAGTRLHVSRKARVRRACRLARLLNKPIPVADTHSLSLLAQIRRIAPGTPIILMTAFGTPELVADALDLGAYDVMDKPFDMNELEAVVARGVRRSPVGERD